MNNYALVFRPEVREELDEAYSWYESQQSGLDDDFLDCVDEMLNRICLMPETYAVVYRDVRRAVRSARSKLVAGANLITLEILIRLIRGDRLSWYVIQKALT